MRPKILQLCAVDFTIFHFLLPLMRAQRDWGFEVEAACSAGEHIGLIQAEGFSVRAVPIPRSRNPLKLWRAYRALGRLFETLDYSAVHVHTPVAALLGRPAARKAGVPIVLYTAHGFYFHEQMKPSIRNLYIGMERWAQGYADFLFSQSDEDRLTALDAEIAPAERVLTIGNGIDLNNFGADMLDPMEKASVRSEFGIRAEHGPVITMMGRLVREKGYFEFIEAWSKIHEKFPEARALIIGDALPSDHDAAAMEIHAAIDELRLRDSIIFAGLRRDVPRLLAASDIFVLPSWREGMPRSIIEAMASGLPVVATDIRGCREEVVHGETGRLVPARNSQALADALIELIESPQLRSRMGAAARRRAEQHFSEDLVIQRQEKIYRQLFREKGLKWPGA